MGTEAIVERILADAEAEADAIIREAEEHAEAVKAEAREKADRARAETEEEATERSRRISEGKAAAARLDSSKVWLAEKRRVIDEIYARALEKLLTMSRHDSLELMGKLLSENAEKGDEIVFAKNFAYAAEASKLAVVKELGLTVSKERADVGGGCILRGKNCDKDLSYSALLRQDREAYQAEIAEKLFKVK